MNNFLQERLRKVRNMERRTRRTASSQPWRSAWRKGSGRNRKSSSWSGRRDIPLDGRTDRSRSCPQWELSTLLQQCLYRKTSVRSFPSCIRIYLFIYIFIYFICLFVYLFDKQQIQPFFTVNRNRIVWTLNQDNIWACLSCLQELATCRGVHMHWG